MPKDPRLEHFEFDDDPLTETFTYTDAESGNEVVIRKNPFTGAWLHPKKGHDICGARSSSFVIDGVGSPLCMNSAGARTDHLGAGKCKFHGGTTVFGNEKGKALLSDIRARKSLKALGHPLEVDPVDALLHLVHESAGNVAFLGGRVSDLGFAVVGDVMALSREGDPVAVSEEARAIVRLYNEERDRLAKTAKMAIDAGIAEREVRLLEDQAAMIVVVLKAVVARLALPPEDQTRALAYLSDELRNIDRTPIEAQAYEVLA